MEFALLPTVNAALVSADTLIIALTSDGLTATGRYLDQASSGALSATVKAANFEAKLGQTLSLYQLNSVSCSTILVVGAGDSKELTGRALQKLVASAYKAIGNKAQTVYSFLSELTITDRIPTQVLTDIVRANREASYRFDNFKKQKNHRHQPNHDFCRWPRFSQLCWSSGIGMG
jgi:leucyl aminopeptidase